MMMIKVMALLSHDSRACSCCAMRVTNRIIVSGHRNISAEGRTQLQPRIVRLICANYSDHPRFLYRNFLARGSQQWVNTI